MFRQALRTAVRVGVRSMSTGASAQAASTGRRAVLAGAAGVTVAAYTYATMPTAECASWSSWLFGTADWDAIRKDIEAVIEANEAGPLLVRLAWHCAGTYDKTTNTGGSNGATMRFSPESDHGANKGLNIARDLLEPIKAKYPKISYADLYTFAGKAAIEYMGGPQIPWRAGRTDVADGSTCPKDGGLPDASQGAAHIRDIFYRMGFNDREIVALVGAHTLGRCHTDRSGYDGPWTFDPNGFDNSFFTLLLSERWTVRPNFTPLQYEDSSKQLMMLPADLALIVDPKFRAVVEVYAKEPETFNKDFAAAFGKLLELGVPRK